MSCSPDRKATITIVGAGNLAIEYFRTLRVLGYESEQIVVIGRGVDSATRFYRSTGINPLLNGLSGNRIHSDYAIVVTNISQLTGSVLSLLGQGVKKILVEKPLSLTYKEIKEVNEKATAAGAKVYIAYNRRFFSSVILLKRRIEQEGGLQNLHFDFTERALDAEGEKHTYEERQRWGIANSSHVIDLALYLLPGRITFFDRWTAKSTDSTSIWFPSNVRFVGSGRTSMNSFFTYSADWEGGGRWGIEATTLAGKYFLRPLEQLHFMERGSFKILQISDDIDDDDLKPGFHGQVKAFLNGDYQSMCEINDYVPKYKFMKKILGYED